MSELLMPPYPNGSVQQQLTQQYSYLFQMAQQLNMALSALEGGAVSTAGNSGQPPISWTRRAISAPASSTTTAPPRSTAWRWART